MYGDPAKSRADNIFLRSEDQNCDYNGKPVNVAITNIIYEKQQLYSLRSSAIYHLLKEEYLLKNRRKRGVSLKCFKINTVIGLYVNLPSRCSRNGHRLNNLAPVNRCSVEPSSSGRPFNVCPLNVRSVKNKTLQIKDFAADKQVDFLAITETWIKPDDSFKFFIRDICPKGYNFLQSPRSSGSGGGLAVLHKSHFKVEYEKKTISVLSPWNIWNCYFSQVHPLLISLLYIVHRYRRQITLLYPNSLRNSLHFWNIWSLPLAKFSYAQTSIYMSTIPRSTPLSSFSTFPGVLI